MRGRGHRLSLFFSFPLSPRPLPKKTYHNDNNGSDTMEGGERDGAWLTGCALLYRTGASLTIAAMENGANLYLRYRGGGARGGEGRGEVLNLFGQEAWRQESACPTHKQEESLAVKYHPSGCMGPGRMSQRWVGIRQQTSHPHYSKPGRNTHGFYGGQRVVGGRRKNHTNARPTIPKPPGKQKLVKNARMRAPLNTTAESPQKKKRQKRKKLALGPSIGRRRRRPPLTHPSAL